MKLLESVLDLLFPPKCPFCGKILDHPGICPVCKSTLPWILEGETLWELPSGVRCAAPLWYEDLARKGLLRLKFHGVCAAAEPLGALIAHVPPSISPANLIPLPGFPSVPNGCASGAMTRQSCWPGLPVGSGTSNRSGS